MSPVWCNCTLADLCGLWLCHVHVNPAPCAQVLGLASYPPLMARLTPDRRREMALTVVRAVLKGDTKVTNQFVMLASHFRFHGCARSAPRRHPGGYRTVSCSVLRGVLSCVWVQISQMVLVAQRVCWQVPCAQLQPVT